jgi:transposase
VALDDRIPVGRSAQVRRRLKSARELRAQRIEKARRATEASELTKVQAAAQEASRALAAERREEREHEDARARALAQETQCRQQRLTDLLASDAAGPSAAQGANLSNARASRRRPRTDATVNQQVVDLAAAGTRVCDIAAQVGLAHSTVSYKLKRWRSGQLPLNEVERKESFVHGGRPPAMTGAMTAAAARFLCLAQNATLAMVQGFLHRHWPEARLPAVTTIGEHLRHQVGLRTADFRRIPTSRNSPYAIKARRLFCWQAFKHKSALKWGVWVDEMGISLNAGKGTVWGLRGFKPSIPAADATASEKNHATVIAAVCPGLGLVYWEPIIKRKVDHTVFLGFLDRLLPDWLGLLRQKGIQPYQALLMWDNAGFHKTQEVSKWVSDHGQVFKRHALPPYSPFLNPIEEVFAVWKKAYLGEELRLGKSNSKQGLVQLLALAQRAITKDLVAACFHHTTLFWPQCIKGIPVTREELYERTHSGDDEVALPKEVEMALRDLRLGLEAGGRLHQYDEPLPPAESYGGAIREGRKPGPADTEAEPRNYPEGGEASQAGLDLPTPTDEQLQATLAIEVDDELEPSSSPPRSRAGPPDDVTKQVEETAEDWDVSLLHTSQSPHQGGEGRGPQQV